MHHRCISTCHEHHRLRTLARAHYSSLTARFLIISFFEHFARTSPPLVTHMLVVGIQEKFDAMAWSHWCSWWYGTCGIEASPRNSLLYDQFYELCHVDLRFGTNADKLTWIKLQSLASQIEPSRFRVGIIPFTVLLKSRIGRGTKHILLMVKML